MAFDHMIQEQSEIGKDVKFLKAAEEKRQMQQITTGHFMKAIQSGNGLHAFSLVMSALPLSAGGPSLVNTPS